MIFRLNGHDISKFNAKARGQLHLQPPNYRPYMRKHYFQLRNKSFIDAKHNLLSFVFVRDPFERIVSSYYDKMDRDWSKPAFDLRWMRDEIIQKLVVFVPYSFLTYLYFFQKIYFLSYFLGTEN